MLRIKLTIIQIAGDQVVIGILAEGHVGLSAGPDIVCSAATSLLRSFIACVPGKVAAPKEGFLDYESESVPISGSMVWSRRCGASEVLLKGLRQIVEEYPRQISLIKDYLYSGG